MAGRQIQFDPQFDFIMKETFLHEQKKHIFSIVEYEEESREFKNGKVITKLKFYFGELLAVENSLLFLDEISRESGERENKSAESPARTI
jgi:hypothetical protein